MNPHPEAQSIVADSVNSPRPAITETQRLAALGRQSLLAFWRDLATLIKEHPGQWVAYHGDTQLGIGPTRYDLWLECERRGYKDDEIMIRSIEPEDPDVVAAFDQPISLVPQ